MDLLKRRLIREANELASEFDAARESGKGSPSEVSDRREDALRGIVKRYFPPPFDVVKGQIQDTNANISASIDCIVLRHTHPNLRTSGDKHEILIAEGVDFAVELKTNAADKKEIVDLVRQCNSLKALRKIIDPSDDSPLIPSRDRLVIQQIPYFCFAAESSASLEEVWARIHEQAKKTGVSFDNLPDGIIVNNVGAILIPRGDGLLGALMPPGLRGAMVMHLGNESLACMLWLASAMPRHGYDNPPGSALRYYVQTIMAGKAGKVVHVDR